MFDGVELAAKVAHEMSRAYRLATIGNDCEDWPRWAVASQRQKDAARAGIEALMNRQGWVLGRTPEEVHIDWMDQKVGDGWSYGPVSDPEKKEHPDLVPYSHLPKEQRVRDHLFDAAVRAVIGGVAALDR